MAAQAAIYLPMEDADLRKVFPNATTDRSLIRRASYYEVELNGETVRFNVMPKQEIPGHLLGLQSYVQSLPDPEDQKTAVIQAARKVRTVFGLLAQSEFVDNAAIWESLLRIAQRFDGFLFVYSSVILSDSTVAVGPLLATLRDDESSATDEADDEDEDDDDEEFPPPTAERVAERALVMCAVVCRGFLESDAGNASAETFRQSVVDWLDEMGLAGELEEHECQLLQAPLGTADPQAVVNATWSSEGLAVLAWALDYYDLPAYDQPVMPIEVSQSLGFRTDEALELLADAELLPFEEITALQASILAAHWWLRQYRLKPEPMDFTEFVRTAWFGPLSLEGLRLVDGDLAIGDVSIHRATDQERAHCASILQERHKALNWLAGWDAVYSEVDTPT